MSSHAFVDRIFRNLPAKSGRFAFTSWKHAGKATKEGVGILPTTVDVEAVAARIMDVDHYTGNLDFVEACRTIDDPAHTPPKSVRFYQRIKLPVIGVLHHELVMEDLGTRDGWRVIAWHLHPASSQLNKREGIRSDYNDGAWLLRPDAIGYSLSSAPSKADVGRIKYAALTKGADAGAARAVQANIEGMLRWSKQG